MESGGHLGAPHPAPPALREDLSLLMVFWAPRGGFSPGCGVVGKGEPRCGHRGAAVLVLGSSVLV